MTDSALLAAYRFHRSTYPARPAIALQRARADVAGGNARHCSGYWWKPGHATMGAPFEGGLRWIENAAALGFRFVGWADEIAKREGYRRAIDIDHKGWYTDSFGDGDVLRGAVYQLPARHGKPVYFPAYREGNETRGGWQDSAYMDDHDAAVIDMSDSIAQRIAQYESPWQAARAADSLAERAARETREYNDAWQAARQWDETRATIAAAWAKCREICAAMRRDCAVGHKVYLRELLGHEFQEMRELREKRDSLDSEFWYSDSDGKQWSIRDFAACNI